MPRCSVAAAWPRRVGTSATESPLSDPNPIRHRDPLALPPPPNRPPQNGQGVKGRSRHMDRLAEPGHPTLYALQPSQSFPPARLTTIFGGGMGVGFP